MPGHYRVTACDDNVIATLDGRPALEVMKEAIGELPLAGFFCNGGISHDRLYGYTGVLSLFH